MKSSIIGLLILVSVVLGCSQPEVEDPLDEIVEKQDLLVDSRTDLVDSVAEVRWRADATREIVIDLRDRVENLEILLGQAQIRIATLEGAAEFRNPVTFSSTVYDFESASPTQRTIARNAAHCMLNSYEDLAEEDRVRLLELAEIEIWSQLSAGLYHSFKELEVRTILTCDEFNAPLEIPEVP